MIHKMLTTRPCILAGLSVMSIWNLPWCRAVASDGIQTNAKVVPAQERSQKVSNTLPGDDGPDRPPGVRDPTTPHAQLGEVLVTARRVKENIQNVPIAVSVFTAPTIVHSGMENFGDFAARVPGLNFQSGCAFECEDPILIMRGIGNTEEGWPPVSYIVDGVPADSVDSFMVNGALENVERIEVLRGPQSALYGFNAIAGAINVVTKLPTNEWEGDARALYGNGNALQASGGVSGPLIPDKVLFRLDAGYENNHGLIRSASNGIDLDFNDSKHAQLRLLSTPIDALTIDLHASIDREHEGAVYQDRVPVSVGPNDFSGRYANAASRAFPGVQDRSLDRYAARIEYEFPGVSLISVSAFALTHQSVPTSSICYDDPNSPQVPLMSGGVACVFDTAYGRAAAPGEEIDEFYSDLNNYRSYFQDLRLASRGSGTFEWTIGASAFYRRAFEGFAIGPIVAPNSTYDVLFQQWNLKLDNWWGVYGQVIWNATPKLQFTLATRYDEERYANTAYSNRDATIIVPVKTASGALNTQHNVGDAFQPEGEISYHFADTVMGYATVSRGFRAGFYYNGSYTLPTKATNYELGIKSTAFAHRLLVNADMFHIDYLNQQVTTFIGVPPFLTSSNIPKTRINGTELESDLVLSRFATVGVAATYMDAEVGSRTQPNDTPKLYLSPSADLSYPISGDWNVILHFDDLYESSEFLGKNNTQYRGPINLLNGRLAFESDKYSVAAFVRNAADRRYPLGFTTSAQAIDRYQNEPRNYGMEVRVHF